METKNQMLEDKNETIETLKLELESLRQEGDRKNNEMASVRDKYSHSKKQLKEIEVESARILQ